jgi:hypothetical protein
LAENTAPAETSGSPERKERKSVCEELDVSTKKQKTIKTGDWK